MVANQHADMKDCVKGKVVMKSTADQTQEAVNGETKGELCLKQSWEIQHPDEQMRKPKQTGNKTK